MKIISFNINGLRARLHQLSAIIETHRPDVIGLQETKVNDPDFPLAAIESLGYQVFFFGQKSHYGVALLFRVPMLQGMKGFVGESEEAQRRFVACEIEWQGRPLWVCNGYFPQGESRDHPLKFPHKKRFYEQVTNFVQEKIALGLPLVLMGDMNVAPEEKDVGIGQDNAVRWLRSGKCSFLPEERQWLQRLVDAGLQDSYRLHHKEAEGLSWFDYRSRGFEAEPRRGLRIDFILASNDLLPYSHSAGIDYDIRGMERPSDHCPIWWQMRA